MQIDFFEEFPTRESLEKLRLIDWPSTVYIAAPSLQRFRQLEKQSKKINSKLKYGYWPALKIWEGYWLSEFSSRKAIIRTMDELKQNKKPLILLWDYEFPLLNPLLFIAQLFNYRNNKKLIYDFIKNANQYKIMVSIAENKPALPDNLGDKRIIMAYSSDFGVAPENALIKKIKSGNKFRDKLEIGLGCIAPGILRIEPHLSSMSIDRDLSILKKNKIACAVIFRLGGLNKEYVRVLKKYL